MISALSGGILILINNVISSDNGNLTVFLFIIFIVMLLILAIYYISRLRQIGEIEFSQFSVQKSIGDLKENWSIDTIKEILLHKHMKEILWQTNEDKIRTYLMITKFKDNTEQKIIIGSKSVDKPEISLKKILKILEKTNKINYSIK